MNGLSMRMIAGVLAVAVMVAGCGDGGKKPAAAAKPKPARPTQLDEPPKLALPEIPAAGDAHVLPAWAALTNAAAVKAAITTGESTWPAEFLAPGGISRFMARYWRIIGVSCSFAIGAISPKARRGPAGAAARRSSVRARGSGGRRRKRFRCRRAQG